MNLDKRTFLLKESPQNGYAKLWTSSELDDDSQLLPLPSSDDGPVFLKPLPAKEEVLRFFLTCEDDDALWVLDGVLSDRSEIFKQAGLLGAASGLRRVHHEKGFGHEKSVDFSSTPRVSLEAAVPERYNALKKIMPRSPSMLGGSSTKGQVREVCSNCDNTLMHDAIFCRKCGHKREEKLASTATHFLPGGTDVMHSGLKKELDRRRVFVSDPVVQFASRVAFAREGVDSESVHEVIRIGNLKGPSEVYYTTEDDSACAAHKFKPIAGKLVFKTGETTQLIHVPLIDDDDWGTTVQFTVRLLEEGIVGATLDKYLFTTRVNVIDDETFPTSRFKKEILAGKIHLVPKFKLLLEYFKLNFNKPKVGLASLKMMVVDQLHLVQLTIRIMMNLYLVDHVLNANFPAEDLIIGDRSLCLVLIMVINLTFTGILHVVDHKWITWRVPGMSRMMIQSALLTKFLNYDEKSREQIKQGDIVMGVTRDAHRLVDWGYMNIFVLIHQISKIIVLVTLRFGIAKMTGKPVNITVILLLFAFPLIKVPFGLSRRFTNAQVVLKQHIAQNELAHHITETVQNYRIIADFDGRMHFIERFKQRINEYNDSTMDTHLVRVNNKYFGIWLSMTVIAVYTYCGGLAVVNGEVSMGNFLADVHILRDLGEAWGTIFHTVMDLQMSLPDLERIVAFLNMPIDLHPRMKLHSATRALSRTKLEELRKRNDIQLPVDSMPIMVENPGFESPGQSLSDEVTRVSIMGTMNFEQGRMISLVGPRGEGKGTLLKILGGVNLPIALSGSFFIPPHLRVLHFATEALFFHGNLYDNLTFGVSRGMEDASVERVVAICKSLDLPPNILALIETDEIRIWWAELSQSQKHLLCIARALIANPEILCMHKPVQVFDRIHAIEVLDMLKQFVLCKGIEQDPHSVHLRRPRTCIFTSSTMMGVETSDQVFHVSVQDGIQELDKSSVTMKMLG